MRSAAKYNTAINLLFLAIIAIAYTGKTFHHHNKEYYADYERTECSSDGRSSIADDCPICHFSFYTCLYAAVQTFAFAVLLLVDRIGEPMPKCVEKSPALRPLRAPPTES